MTPVPFEIKIVLESHLGDQRIKLQFQDKDMQLEKTNEQELKLVVSYGDDVDRIKLIEFSRFEANPSSHIQIKEMSINGYRVEDFYQLLSFDMKDNLYVENKNIRKPQMIDFNGSLYLEVGANRDRFTFHPITFSKDKRGLVLSNAVLNCQDEYICWGSGRCIHDPPWQKFDFKKYVNRDHYDYVALGCSITFGVGVLENQAWPSLLEQDGRNVLNLGTPGAGADQMLLNAKELIRRKIKFSKMILLLPNAGRQLSRISKHGIFFNYLLQANSTPEKIDDHFNIYFTLMENEAMIQKGVRRLVMADVYRRNERIVRRLISFLGKNSVDFYISSWDDDTYDLLKSCVTEPNLLPKFNEGKDASKGIDGWHPSEKIHKRWIDNIKELINQHGTG